jgi:nucleoside-diphosphate-sugar epimerase
MYETILITGANGYIGTNLTRYLLEHNDKTITVRAFIQPGTNRTIIDQYQANYGKDRLTIHEGDLFDSDSLVRALENVTIVIHLAGLVTDWAPASAYFHSIVDGTQNLLNAIERVNSTAIEQKRPEIRRIIYMSSLTVHAMDGHCEDDECAPRNMHAFPYGIAKARAEDLVAAWTANRPGRDYAAVRPGFIIYGPYDRASYISAIDAMMTGTFGFLNGGKARISYVYIENLVYGMNKLVSADHIHGPYIILDGDKTWKDWVTAWCTTGGVPLPKMNVPYWLIAGPIALLELLYKLFRIKKSPPLNLYRLAIARRDLAFSDRKFRTEFGYDPPVKFEDTLIRTLDYYKIWKEETRKK